MFCFAFSTKLKKSKCAGTQTYNADHGKNNELEI